MFTVYACDDRNSFPTKTFASLVVAVHYGVATKKTFAVCKPSGFIVVSKPYADSEVRWHE